MGLSAADIYWVAVCYPYFFLSLPIYSYLFLSHPIDPYFSPLRPTFSFVIPKINYIFVCG